PPLKSVPQVSSEPLLTQEAIWEPTEGCILHRKTTDSFFSASYLLVAESKCWFVMTRRAIKTDNWTKTKTPWRNGIFFPSSPLAKNLVLFTDMDWKNVETDNSKYTTKNQVK